MASIQITTAHNIEVEYELAGLGERMLAGLIDLSIIIGYWILIFFLQDILFTRYSNHANTWVLVILFMPVAFYSLISELLMNGQTVGKKVMKIKVVSLVGETPSIGQYIIRWLFRLLDIWITSYTLGVIMVAASAKHQRIGDIIAGTTLIKTNSKTSLSQTLLSLNHNPDYDVTYVEVIHLKDKDIRLVKEVLMNVRKTGNTMLALELMRKLEALLTIKSKQDPAPFLQTVLNDYNYLASKL